MAAAEVACCLAGHELAGAGRRRPCPRCRREAVAGLVAAAETSLPRPVIEAAVAAVAPSGQALSQLAAALAADPGALARGAPPVAGRLAAELITRGSKTLTLPACARCGRAGIPLYRTPGGGMCKPCTARQVTAACAHCGVVKPVASRDSAGQRICERCRRHDRGHRRCGVCGRTASIAVRARGGAPDICVNCYQLPSAVCSACGKYRECNFARSDHPVCPSCSPRAAARCARCGQDRPPQARWPEGPVCDPCYTAALRRRGPCSGCGELRRLVAPPGPAATTCATCAGLEAMCVCADCGIEDKLYEKGRCCRCSLRRRAAALLSGGTGQVPAELAAVLTAICSARNPRTALNWMRAGAGAAILADLAAGQIAAAHQALDQHPRPRAAGYLRQMLVAGAVLPPRDEELARAEQWLAGLLASMTVPEHRRLVRAFATWQVMPRLRRTSQARRRPRTYTARARNMISATVRFLSWLSARGTPLPACRQADIDDWLTAGPGAADVRDFLAWAARQGHCQLFDIPRPPQRAGTAIGDSQRWDLVTRLLHDDSIQVTDRVAGCLVLLFGQTMTRVAAMTTSQVTRRGDGIYVQFGRHEVPVPGTLGSLLLTLIADGKPNTGTGSPAVSQWLFPGLLPGQPITPARLAGRLRALGIPVQAGRRAALTGLAAQLPAAVLADTLGLQPGTAVRWMHDAGADWNRYAADLARTRNHQPRE
jgi:hypothetical protein